MRKQFGIILFCMVTSMSICLGQTTWTQGYVITNRGDTLHGKIRYTPPGQRAVMIVFEENGKDEKFRFKPFNIRSFFMEGSIYDSKIYDIDPMLNYGFGVFMERMNEGRVKIYQYWNTDKDRGFTQTFIENDGDYLLEVSSMQFKKQMTRYFEEYPELQERIRKGEFRKKDLMAIVEEYNDWKDSEW